MASKVINRNSLLQSLLDDSNRLAPFTLALLDDLDSTAKATIYLRHLVKFYTQAKYPKHLTILCLEHLDTEAFVLKNRLAVNSNVVLLSEDDLADQSDNDCDLLNGQSIAKLASYNKPNVDNVLVIDSLVPLFMSRCGVKVETATKSIITWLNQLHDSFSHIAFVLHTDFLADRYLELAVTYASSAVIDFRPKSGLSEKQLTCPLMKLTTGSIHVHVIARKKHPRTHLKVARKHEHFQVDANGDITKHMSSDELAKILETHNKAPTQASETASQAVPESTFNLTLKKDEQEAKDNLILPYIRKNTNAINTNAPSLSGQVAPNSTTGGNNSSSGQVTYTYDRFDDFDEDDPDDDLDF